MWAIFTCLAIITSTFSLLFLPSKYLLNWQSISLGLCIGLVFLQFVIPKSQKLKIMLIIFCVALGYAHYCAQKVLNLSQANLNLPSKFQSEIFVEKIYHNQKFITIQAIAILPTHKNPQKIYLNWRGESPPNLGETFQGILKLHPVSARLNFNGFNRSQWLFAQGITATGSITNPQLIKTSSNLRTNLLSHSRQLTNHLSQQGLLLALGFGERAWLDPAVQNIFQRTNTSHLIAISGLHIGLAFLLGMWLAKYLSFLLPTHLIYGATPRWIGLMVACIYAWLAGGAIPTLRAICALELVLLIQHQRYRLSPYNYFLIVIAILLIFDPLMILSTSFWLSAGAVASLLLWYRIYPLNYLSWRGNPLPKICQWLWGLIHLQLGLLLIFTPVQAFLFNGFSLMALPLNLITVPIFSFLLVPLVLLAIFSKSSTLWLIANHLAQMVVNFLSLNTDFFVDLSNSQVYLISLLCWGGLLIIKWRKNIFLAVSIILLSLGLWQSWNYLNAYKTLWQSYMFDVGQGLAILLVKNKQGILYDTGASWRGGSMAQLEILPFLKREGIQLDYIILSHDDLDHAGGLMDLLKSLPPPKAIISPSPYQQHKLSNRFPKLYWKRCQAGYSLNWQGLTLKMLAPQISDPRKAGNDQSCVILVKDSLPRLLLMGDAPQGVEKNLMADLPTVDILQVGHHGSTTSSNVAFLRQISPKLALVSASRWNHWNLPKPVIRKRFQQLQIPLLNTGEVGGIKVNFQRDSFQVLSARHDLSPWYSTQ